MTAPTWKLSELVTFGIARHVEASRKHADYIVVQQIGPSSSRMSCQIVELWCVVRLLKETAQRSGCAFCVLQRGMKGWIVADFLNVTGDRSNVDTSLAATVALCKAEGA